jgi:hypothetical protein
MWILLTLLLTSFHSMHAERLFNTVKRFTTCSTEEHFLITHLQECIKRVEDGYRIPPELSRLHGMSNDESRSLLNLLCSMPDTNYLEIGLWKGSTFISALYGNSKTITNAIGIDNWSENGGPKDEFFRNCAQFIPAPENRYQIYSENYSTVNQKKAFPQPINVFFYDGNLQKADLEQAFTAHNDILANTFIVLIDDWNSNSVWDGTFEAFKRLGYTVLFERALPVGTFWFGMYAAVIRKNGAPLSYKNVAPQAVFSLFEKMTPREELLVNHVKTSIGRVESGYRVPSQILNIPGMSSPKGRSLLNLLCSLPGTKYLEIGCWKGSTFVSALHGNSHALAQAYAIDNWAAFTGPKNEFLANCSRFLPISQYQYTVYSEDCFAINKNKLGGRINVYFYDGEHERIDQEKAFTYFDDILDDVFIAVVDDWNPIEAREGTFEAFKKLNYTILFEQVLPARFNGDVEQWWHGFYVAVIRKN